MFRLSRVLLPVVAVSFVAGCSSSNSDVQKAIDDVFNKSSVTLTGLKNHVISYEYVTGGTPGKNHDEKYCADGLNDNKGNVIGNWSWDATAQQLTVNNTSSSSFSYIYLINDTVIKKNSTYTTTTNEQFKVTKISDTICL